MQTPATSALDAAGVAYSVTEYTLTGNHAEGYGLAMAAALGVDPDAAGKSLIAELDDGRYVVAVVPISGSLDLKALARAAGVKRAAMAAPAVAERLTGSVIGGIAPFGHRQRLDVFLDALLTASEIVHVSGGRRGLEISLSPVDLIAVTGAIIADLDAS